MAYNFDTIRRQGTERAMTDELSPPEAWKLIQQDPQAVLLDVRSRMEFDYVGHPTGALHIPWAEPPEWVVDPGFTDKVRAAISALRESTLPPEERTVLTLCRSGKRSEAAAAALTRAGFKNAINVAEGFEGDRDTDRHRNSINGWRVHGLPWEQT